MMKLIILILVTLPIFEIATFIEVGGYLGLWPTIGLVFLTGSCGILLLRQQGLVTVLKAQEAIRQQRLPVNEIFDGVCIVVAGISLIIPGFISDIIGLLLFWSLSRYLLKRILWRYIYVPYKENKDGIDVKKHHKFDGSVVIDGEYEDLSSPKKKINKNPGE